MLRSCCLPALALVAGTMTAAAHAQEAPAGAAAPVDEAGATAPPVTPEPAPSGTAAAPTPPAATSQPSPSPTPDTATAAASTETAPAAAPEADPAAAPAVAAAPPPPVLDATAYDPLEGLNRVVWDLNQGIDAFLLRPVTVVYRTVTPRPLRRGLSRVLSNLSEPFSAINALLQGKPKRARNSLARFVINTTIGVGGLADHASRMGLKPTPEDFGQTLAAWGVRGGPYLVLPLLGPSTFRDGVGSGVAQYADPYRIGLREIGLTRTQRYGVVAFEAVNARSNLIDAGADTLLKSSADPYATARSAYLQRRAAQIADQDDSGATSAGSDDAAVNAALRDAEGDAGAAATEPAAAPAAPEGTPLPADPSPAAAPSPQTPQQDTPTPASPK